MTKHERASLESILSNWRSEVKRYNTGIRTRSNYLNGIYKSLEMSAMEIESWIISNEKKG